MPPLDKADELPKSDAQVVSLNEETGELHCCSVPLGWLEGRPDQRDEQLSDPHSRLLEEGSVASDNFGKPKRVLMRDFALLHSLRYLVLNTLANTSVHHPDTKLQIQSVCSGIHVVAADQYGFVVD
jgi:hypothetical protein